VLFEAHRYDEALAALDHEKVVTGTFPHGPRGRKQFFFEKKNQKLLRNLAEPNRRSRSQNDQAFFALFFLKKAFLPLYLLANCIVAPPPRRGGGPGQLRKKKHNSNLFRLWPFLIGSAQARKK
jgi:hypothetical protein